MTETGSFENRTEILGVLWLPLGFYFDMAGMADEESTSYPHLYGALEEHSVLLKKLSIDDDLPMSSKPTSAVNNLQLPNGSPQRLPRGRSGSRDSMGSVARDCSGSVAWRLSDSVFRQRVDAVCKDEDGLLERKDGGSVPPLEAGVAANPRQLVMPACCCYSSVQDGDSLRRGRCGSLTQEELERRSQEIERGVACALDTPNLLDEFQYVKQKLANKSLCVFLDYDGTLTPIVPDPREAQLSEGVRATLKKLATVYPVAIITGRRLETIRKFVRLSENPKKRTLMYAASHGFDIDAAGFGLHVRHQVGEAGVSALRSAVASIMEIVGDIKGLYVEDNYFAVSIHYRHCPEHHAALALAVDSVIAEFPMLRKCLGLELIEIRVDAQWDKGCALSWILNAIGLDRKSPDLAVIYIGDDLTDEDAFRMVRSCALGIAVVVSPQNRNTFATLHLDNVSQVRIFLDALVGFPCTSAIQDLNNGATSITLSCSKAARRTRKLLRCADPESLPNQNYITSASGSSDFEGDSTLEPRLYDSSFIRNETCESADV